MDYTKIEELSNPPEGELLDHELDDIEVDPVYLQPRKDRRLKSERPLEMPKERWEMLDLRDLHHQIKRRIFLGQKNNVIAESLGCTSMLVSYIRNSKQVQDELAKLHTRADLNTIDIRKEIDELAPKAIRVLEQLLESDGVAPNVKLTAAKDILDRSGNSAPQQINHLHGHFTSDDLRDIKERACKIANIAGD